MLGVGACVNARSNLLETPLHLAARDGQRDVAKALLAAGADVHAETKSGATPLEYARRGEQKETAALLQ